MNTIDINIDEIMNETMKKMEPIPLGQSQFQNRNFVQKTMVTRGRAYRACLMKLKERLDALYANKEAYDISLANKEAEEKIMKLKSSRLDFIKTQTEDFTDVTGDLYHLSLEGLELEKEINEYMIKKDSAVRHEAYQTKLIKDCIYEIQGLYKDLKKYREMTTEEFEIEENVYYKLKLNNILNGAEGARESLMAMESPALLGVDFDNVSEEELGDANHLIASFQFMEEGDPETLRLRYNEVIIKAAEEARQTMSNQEPVNKVRPFPKKY
jgi:hypothetical protein